MAQSCAEVSCLLTGRMIQKATGECKELSHAAGTTAHRSDIRKKDDFEAVGALVRVSYGLMGRYVAMLIADALDDETVMRATVKVAARGFVSSETLRAFTEEKFSKLVGELKPLAANWPAQHA